MERRYRPLRWTRIYILVVVGIVLQTTILGEVRIQGVRPGLLLPLVIVFAAGTHWRAAGLLGWIVGISKDLFSGTPFGTFALLYTLVGFGCSHTAQRTFVDHVMTMGIIALVVGLAVNAGCILVTVRHFQDLPSYLHKGFVSSLLVPVVVMIIYPLVRKSRKTFGMRYGTGR